MKKTYISCTNGGTEVASYRNDGSEADVLYVGIDAVYGGWIVQDSSGADAYTLNDLETAYMDGNEPVEILINSFKELIANPSTSWEELDEEDLEYIQEWLETWGLK